MRNRYSGICYRCDLYCGVGAGHFERYRGSWRVIHAQCAIDQRSQKSIDAAQRAIVEIQELLKDEPRNQSTI